MNSSHLDPLNLNRQGPKPSKAGTFERSNVPDPLGCLGPLGGKNPGTADAPQRMTMLRATPIAEAASPRMTMLRRPA